MKNNIVIDYLILTLSLGLYLFFNQLGGLTLVLLVMLGYRFWQSSSGYQRLFLLLSACALLVANFMGRYSVTMVAAILTSLTAFVLVCSHLKKSSVFQSWTRVKGVLSWSALVVLTVLHLFFISAVVNPDWITSQTNVFFGLKAVPEKKASQEKQADGSIYYRDLTYPSQLGNNKLDIYTTPNAKGTIFYIHGGGYAGDDKFYREDYLFRYVKDGYNVVNVNYLLAPQARYKDGLKQVNEALAYVAANAVTYGIDTKKIILSGDSAGGQLAGQLALVLTNSDYAKQINVTPASAIRPKGYIGVSAWSDIQMGMKTGLFLFDWLVTPLARSYFQVLDVAQDRRVEEASILKNVNEDFPASFISDGNFGSFTASNLALVKRLKALGVSVASQFYDPKQVKLGHIFELSLDNPYAQDVYTKQLDFLNQVLD